MALDQAGLDLLFNDARTHSHWKDEPVSDDTLRNLYELLRMAPTSGNCSPGRFVFVRSPEAKARLKPALDEGNVAKTMAAPVTAIVATDFEFYEKLPKLFPHTDARSWFAGKPEAILWGGFRNGTLQGAYLILAARALGLDCGPMSGFNNALVDETFFAGTPWKSNFLVNLGHGDASRLHARSPRLDFDEACRIE
ncbi:MAG: malonic semialdehyde reductase [Xanthomonadales bacterium]|nr:malonic semialdehyde reductase [Xanthomonadales bacterium]